MIDVAQMEIDWNGLHSAFQMNMPEVKCFLCVDDGQVVKIPPGSQDLADVRANSQRYVAIEAVPSRIQYQWLDGFIATIDEESLKARMEAAINGKGAFRRFKDILLTVPEERRKWFEYRDLMMRQRIIEWVQEQGIDVSNEPDWSDREAEAPQSPQQAQDVDALRDHLIEWSEGLDPAEAMSPLSLERLANAICDKFRVSSK